MGLDTGDMGCHGPDACEHAHFRQVIAQLWNLSERLDVRPSDPISGPLFAGFRRLIRVSSYRTRYSHEPVLSQAVAPPSQMKTQSIDRGKPSLVPYFLIVQPILRILRRGVRRGRPDGGCLRPSLLLPFAIPLNRERLKGTATSAVPEGTYFKSEARCERPGRRSALCPRPSQAGTSALIPVIARPMISF